MGTKSEILTLMESLELTANMQEFMEKSVSEFGATIIIISDSNSEFIDHILKAYKLDSLVKEVFTNPATWAEEGCLLIEPHHHQESCTLSTKNLCKGQILENYLVSSGDKFSFTCYVGDGKNDFCPALRLGPGDMMCVRAGYSLETYIPKMKEKGHTIRADLMVWSDASQIMEHFKKKMSS